MTMSFGMGFRPGRAADAAPPAAPVNTVVPSISGTPVVGQTLTANRGAWTGSPAPSYAYQWQRGGVNISGATSQAYQLAPADDGASVRVVVTAINASGSASAASSAVTVSSGVSPGAFSTAFSTAFDRAA